MLVEPSSIRIFSTETYRQHLIVHVFDRRIRNFLSQLVTADEIIADIKLVGLVLLIYIDAGAPLCYGPYICQCHFHRVDFYGFIQDMPQIVNICVRRP